MDQAQRVGAVNPFDAMLKAKFSKPLPRLGSGVNLFNAQPLAAGNSKMQASIEGANIHIVA